MCFIYNLMEIERAKKTFGFFDNEHNIDNILDDIKNMRILMKGEIDIMNHYIKDIDIILNKYKIQNNTIYFELIFYSIIYYFIFLFFYKTV
jgi:hypothetical protein